jgi:type IV secretion system protein VirD4
MVFERTVVMPPARLAGLAAALLVALQASTQTFAWLYRYHGALGPALRLDETGVYWPWMILVWRQRFGAAEADAFALPLSVFMLVMAAGAGGLVLFDGGAVKRTRGWGGLAEARRAGLRHGAGCVLGRLQGRLLATTDLRPTLVTGGTRSGKGRGHVVPTLLSWTDSVLVHDPKGELWRVPDAVTDQDPVARAAVDRRIEQLLDDTAARLISGVRPRRETVE